MPARKRSDEIQKAEKQKIQEEVHQILYCDTDWREDEIYGQRFRKIIKRSNIDEASIKINEEAAKEYKKRVERKLSGKERLDKSLVFYKILMNLDSQPMNRAAILTEINTHSEDCIIANIKYLENTKLIEKGGEKYRIASRTKKLLIKSK